MKLNLEKLRNKKKMSCCIHFSGIISYPGTFLKTFLAEYILIEMAL